MITDLKPYAEYKDSGLPWLGEVPRHWEACRMASCIASIESGSREQTNVDESSGVPNFGGEHVGVDGALLLRRMRFVSANYFERMRRGRIRIGDILLVKDGATIGKTAIVRQLPFPRCCVNEHVFIIRPQSKILSGFLYWNLRSPIIQSGIWREVTGSAQPGLNGGFAKALSLAVPPHDEQVAIVRFLENMNARLEQAIRAKRRVIALLNEQKQVIVHRAVTRGLDLSVPLKPSGIPWLGEIPQHWDVERTKNVFRLRTEKSGLAHGKELLSIYTHIGVRPRKDLVQKGNRASTTDNYWIVRKGDLIVNKLLAWMGAVGASDYEGVTSPAYDILMPIRPLCSDYYHHLFRTKLYLQMFKRRSRGIMDMRLRLYFDQLGQIPVPIPPVEEQAAIISFYEDETAGISAAISRLEREIELLREYRARLVADVVTGQFDVREAAARLPNEAPQDNVLDDVGDEAETPDEEATQ